MAGSSQSRCWCFTINNPEPSDNPARALEPLTERIKFAIWQLERGSSGTLHWQGFVQWRSRGRRRQGMARLLPRAHLTVARGSPKANEVYCSKEEGRVEGPYRIGEASSQGKRSDLESVRALLDSGAPMSVIEEQHFGSWCRYRSAFEEYRRKRQCRRTWQTTVKVLYGESGCGKSRLASHLAMQAAERLGSSVYILTDATRHSHGVWWDGYDGEAVVLIEEFSGWFSRNHFKILVNFIDLIVQVKGGSTRFLAKEIFITSNKPPSAWWRMETMADKEGWPEIVRRLRPPIGRVHRCRRNPDVERGDGFEDNGFCVVGDEEDGLDINSVQHAVWVN